MSVLVCHDIEQGVAILWCNTIHRAFGPVFSGETSRADAEDFLGWLADNGERVAGRLRIYVGEGRFSDPRAYTDEELCLLHHEWAKAREEALF